ncbi:hypothetical protein PAXRUDRAFT_829521 [Paxillus rubicundulus Ve08.2h10]|uniref:Uncharacterized protein n=1 Tax=Paxillus rubicundulus Ve08.2h10 TaxID=930991 RepID=A0A0D0E5X0_9AGAM|nr:hypothetical protein PAXRUDRAFT_829521 [Paxillus rubicundulus Ve08.2h10]
MTSTPDYPRWEIKWKRSNAGRPRRIRTDRPLLVHDVGWHWDEKRVLFNKGTDVPEWEESHDDGQPQRDGERYDTGFQESPARAMSLFEIAEHRITKKRQAWTGLDGDFEVIRVPRVIPISDGEVSRIGNGWQRDEWEKVDVIEFRRLYSEVLRTALGWKLPPHQPETRTH